MKRGRCWPIGIDCVLGVTVGANICVYAASRATIRRSRSSRTTMRRPSRGTRRMAQARAQRAARLAHRAALGLRTDGAARSARVTSTDAIRRDDPRRDASTVAAFYNARADSVVHATLAAAGDELRTRARRCSTPARGSCGSTSRAAPSDFTERRRALDAVALAGPGDTMTLILGVLAREPRRQRALRRDVRRFRLPLRGH